MKHTCSIREESRYGVPLEYRIICKCGWQDKAGTMQDAERAAERHKNRPHRT